jgi:hypothetical protein
MFCVKGFAAGSSVGRYFGSVAAVIVATVTAASNVGAKHAGNSDALQTFVTERLSKEGLTRGIARRPIANDWLQFPLWIKVPIMKFPLSLSSRR